MDRSETSSHGRAAEKRNYLYGLDILRFGSALSVAFYHLGYASWAKDSARFALASHGYELPQFEAFAWFGWVGVNVFFVISGFVISQSADRASPASFLKSRILRLYPAIWICAPLTFLGLAIVQYKPLAQLVRSLVATVTLVPVGPAIDGVYWTLGLEIVFYAIVFFMLKTRQWHLAEMLGIALTIISTPYLVLLSLDSAGVLSIPGVQMLGSGNFRLLMFEYGHRFAVGVFLAIAANGRLSAWGRMALCAALVGGVLQIYCQALETQGQVLRGSLAVGSLWWAPASLWLAAVAGIVFAARFRAAVYQLPARSLKWIRQAGLATYPLYLIHYSLGVIAMGLLTGAGLRADLALAVVLTGAVVLSLIVTRGEAVIRSRLSELISTLSAGPLARLGLRASP